jgi:hypothetical protein
MEQVMASVTADLEAPGGAETSDALRHLRTETCHSYQRR